MAARHESLVRSLRIESWCDFPFQLIDWGKNRSNVDTVRSHVRWLQKTDDDLHERVPSGED